MANVQIPNLPAAIALNGSEEIPAVQAGTTVRITAGQLTQFVSASTTAGGSDTQIQYNLSGVLAGDTGFTTNGAGNVTSTGTVQANYLSTDFSVTINSAGGTPYEFGGDGPVYIQGKDLNAYYALYMTQEGLINIGASSAWWNFELLGGINYNGSIGGDTGPGTINAIGYYVNGVPVAGAVVLVGSLPTAVAGARAFVSDSTVIGLGNFGEIVVGGGVNAVPVWSDGTNWYIG